MFQQMGRVLNMNTYTKWVCFRAQHQGWERGAAKHEKTPMWVRSSCFGSAEWGEEQPSTKNAPILARFFVFRWRDGAGKLLNKTRLPCGESFHVRKQPNIKNTPVWACFDVRWVGAVVHHRRIGGAMGHSLTKMFSKVNKLDTNFGAYLFPMAPVFCPIAYRRSGGALQRERARGWSWFGMCSNGENLITRHNLIM